MLKPLYLIIENKTGVVKETRFLEEEAFLAAIDMAEAENKYYSVARIIAETDKENFEWKLYKRNGTEITIKQSFKRSEFVPPEEKWEG